jgi:hypothetical protein
MNEGQNNLKHEYSKGKRMRASKAFWWGLGLILLGASSSGCQGTQLLREVSDFQSSVKGIAGGIRDF